MEKEQIEQIRQSFLEQIKNADMPEESKKSLTEQIENATDEAVEQLVQQQHSGEGQEKVECIFCGIAEGKVKTLKIYENSEVIAFLDINPATKGHTLLIPKKHIQFLFQLPPKTLEALFLAINKIMPVLINVTKAEGVSIYIPQGIGQHLQHLAVNLIPRFKDDKVQFVWERKKVDQNELMKIVSEIHARIGKEEQEEKVQSEVKEKRTEKEEDDVQKIMKQLRRRV